MTVLATFQKFGQFFFKSSGHPDDNAHHNDSRHYETIKSEHDNKNATHSKHIKIIVVMLNVSLMSVVILSAIYAKRHLC